ncbi:heat shock protein 70 [Ceratobasidium sp. AG-I]|nr:heat shock protein 70 [Ceratobasidium sp. AG-I]
MSTKLKIELFENGNDFSDTLTCTKFKELNSDLFRKTMKPDDVSDIVLVGGSTHIPRFSNSSRSTSERASKGINPNKAVAYGTVIQGGILSGEEGVEDVVFIDICPLTMGIKTTGGVFTKLTPWNTVVPTKKSQVFSTAADNQPTALSSSKSLGRGVPQIEVAFKIDANSIVKVGASDKGTGKTESVTITNEKGRLSQDKIYCMVHEAGEFASENKAQRKRIEALHGLQNFIWGLKSQLGDKEGLGGKISDLDKKTILATIKETSDWLGENGQTSTGEDLKEKLQEAHRGGVFELPSVLRCYFVYL